MIVVKMWSREATLRARYVQGRRPQIVVVHVELGLG
jgi:hypothetical protein